MKNVQQIFGVIVPTFFTTNGGVSISEVSRIQAEHKQQNDKFWSEVSDAVSGVYREELSYLGGSASSRKLEGHKTSSENLMQYQGVAERNAQISNLMHAVKLYKRLQGELEHMDLRSHIVKTLPEAPQTPLRALRGTNVETERFMESSNIDEMIAVLDPKVLAKFDLAFFRKANELNSRAAALGKLLSEQGAFFRELVKPLPKGNKQLTQTGWAVTQWERAYSEDELRKFVELRDQLQAEYNDLQKQLNSCRKQIKDAVRAYNLDEERRYQSEYGVYRVEAEKHALEMERIRSAAETLRQQALQEIAALKVRLE